MNQALQTLHKTPKFHLIFWWRNFVEKHSLRRVSGKLPELCYLVVIFSINFPYKCFTVESPTIIVQGPFDAGYWDCFAQ